MVFTVLHTQEQLYGIPSQSTYTRPVILKLLKTVFIRGQDQPANAPTAGNYKQSQTVAVFTRSTNLNFDFYSYFLAFNGLLQIL